MKKVRVLAIVSIAVCLTLPLAALAAKAKTLTGVVTAVSGSLVSFTNGTAATYSADVGNAALTRKNGAVMQFSEILVGDKVEIKGQLWPDNSISALSLRDLSLYTHNSTFTGKIISLDANGGSLVIQSAANGNQAIQINNFTSFKLNGSTATFKDLALGYTATVKGVWDRSSANVVASSVQGSFRLVDIDFVGTLTIRGAGSLTVIGNGNVIYGVDVSKAKLLDKQGKVVSISSFDSGDVLHVWGKHVAGSVAIIGVKVKDSGPKK